MSQHFNTMTSLLIFSVVLSACNLNTVKHNGTENIIRITQTADTAYQNNNLEIAESAYSQLIKTPLVIKTPPVAAKVWFRLGNIYAKTERFGAAERAYKNALAANSKDSKIWHNIGLLQLRQAARAFIEMRKYTFPGEPLNTKANNIINAITNVISSDFATTDEKGTHVPQ